MRCYKPDARMLVARGKALPANKPFRSNSNTALEIRCSLSQQANRVGGKRKSNMGTKVSYTYMEKRRCSLFRSPFSSEWGSGARTLDADDVLDCRHSVA